jgi:glycogen(starch) synthase
VTAAVLPSPSLRRVLLTADAIGGVWPYALELTSALGRHGVEVVLAAMGPPLTPEQRHAAHAAGVRALHERSFRLEWMPDPWDDVTAAGDWLLSLEREVAPDLVHLNQLAFGALPWRAPAIVAVHSCVLSWWRAVLRTDAPPEWTRYRRVVTASLRAAACILAPSRAMLEEATRLYGPFRAAQVIHNARDPQAFAPGRKDELIFAAGRFWDEAKNLDALARVAPKLPWPVYLAGEVGDPELGSGRSAAVRALGTLSSQQMAWWLGRASVFAHPARYEPFGLAVLEAGLAGCALVLGDIPSLRELWQGAALFVDPHDVDQLGRTLHRVILNADLRAEQARLAAVRARTFAPEQFAAAHRAAYLRVLGKAAPATTAQEAAACA